MQMTERSQGSVLLARTCKTQDEIASRVGVSRVAVSKWISGLTKPSTKKRGELRRTYGIPDGAWDIPSNGNGEPDASSASIPRPSRELAFEEPRSRDIPDGVIAKAEELERMAHELMTQVRDDSKATPLEKARVMNSIGATLSHVAKITGQFDIGTRLFRLPMWKRIERAMEVALDGHPDAAEALARELRKLDDDAGAAFATTPASGGTDHGHHPTDERPYPTDREPERARRGAARGWADPGPDPRLASGDHVGSRKARDGGNRTTRRGAVANGRAAGRDSARPGPVATGARSGARAR